MYPNYRQRPNAPVRPFGMGGIQQRQNPFMSPMYRQPQMQQTRPGGGGFLARIFGRSNTTQMVRPTNPFQFGAGMQSTAQSGGIQSMLNPENISRFLGQTQQVLRTAQQVGPMIQQYGPLIKNLPALWKIYRGMSNTSDEGVPDSEIESASNIDFSDVEETADETGSKDEIADHSHIKKSNENKNTKKKTNQNIKKKTNKAPKKYETKESIPKLYI